MIFKKGDPKLFLPENFFTGFKLTLHSFLNIYYLNAYCCGYFIKIILVPLSTQLW